ncbi:MAG: hypothetical protein JO297_09505, partial [Nitrososphaeraceae archaeon]|nr:hypothetical protein [Nitrososphaeraceae archaeon]
MKELCSELSVSFYSVTLFTFVFIRYVDLLTEVSNGELVLNSRTSTTNVSGWLLDAYPLNNKMVFWIKQERNNVPIRLEDNWTHSIYVASDDKAALNSILQVNNKKILGLIKYSELVSYYEKLTDVTRSSVLKLTLIDSAKALILARSIETMHGNRFSKFRLYNVDLMPAQSYFYEQDIFPLAFCTIYNDSNFNLKWHIKDSVWSTHYKLPDFKAIHLKLNPRTELGKLPNHTDKIDSMVITVKLTDSTETIKIQRQSEVDMIYDLTKEVWKIDPDFIFTDNGDSFDFPYLIYRAEKNSITKDLILGRESSIPLKKPTKEGTSYFSYGRIYFKPTAIKLLGRIHIDINNSFIYNDSGLEGLYEIARVCRMPLHTAARASIGKCLSSLQFYYATQKGILIPWKP